MYTSVFLFPNKKRLPSATAFVVQKITDQNGTEGEMDPQSGTDEIPEIPLAGFQNMPADLTFLWATSWHGGAVGFIAMCACRKWLIAGLAAGFGFGALFAGQIKVSMKINVVIILIEVIMIVHTQNLRVTVSLACRDVECSALQRHVARSR
jgi:hypothetical protein